MSHVRPEALLTLLGTGSAQGSAPNETVCEHSQRHCRYFSFPGLDSSMLLDSWGSARPRFKMLSLISFSKTSLCGSVRLLTLEIFPAMGQRCSCFAGLAIPSRATRISKRKPTWSWRFRVLGFRFHFLVPFCFSVTACRILVLVGPTLDTLPFVFWTKCRDDARCCCSCCYVGFPQISGLPHESAPYNGPVAVLDGQLRSTNLYAVKPSSPKLLECQSPLHDSVTSTSKPHFTDEARFMNPLHALEPRPPALPLPLHTPPRRARTHRSCDHVSFIRRTAGTIARKADRQVSLTDKPCVAGPRLCLSIGLGLECLSREDQVSGIRSNIRIVGG